MPAKLYGSVQGISASLGIAGGRIRKAMNDQLGNEAKAIQKLARQMVPEEHGNMESGIKVESDDFRRRWSVVIDEDTPDDTGRYTIGDYLTFLHEGQYNLGEKSREKNVNGLVGPKFLERAFEQRMRTGLIGRLTAAAKRLGILN